MNKIKKALLIIKQNGFLNGAQIIINKIKTKNAQIRMEQNKKDLSEFYKYIDFEEKKPTLHSKLHSDNIKILWFIPDFGIGSGGHLNIFRMIHNLEKLGIISNLAICGNSQWANEQIALDTINNHFFNINSKLFIIEKKEHLNSLGTYDIAMATSWQTAYYVKGFGNCYKKTYFVQDFEPYFYPQGSNYNFAENTYKFDFIGISAGSWIAKKLEKEYSMTCYHYSFSYDKNLYKKHKRKETKKRVFFYARPPTDRRAFELGFLVLKKLSILNPDIEVVFAGWDVSEYKIDFPHFNAGLISLDQLSSLYAQCDVALVLSFTNLSLLPLELLASGCPVVINDSPNNNWIDDNKKLFIYANSTIEDLLEKLHKTLNQQIATDDVFIKNYLENSSWETEAKKVKKILANVLEGKNS